MCEITILSSHGKDTKNVGVLLRLSLMFISESTASNRRQLKLFIMERLSWPFLSF